VVTFRVILIIAPDAPDAHELAPVIQHVNDYMGWMLVAALGTSDEGMHPSFLPRPRSQRSEARTVGSSPLILRPKADPPTGDAVEHSADRPFSVGFQIHGRATFAVD
jgi:hypothetical protein